MGSNWFIEVNNAGWNRGVKVVKWGSEVTTRLDPELYAQAQLRKAIAVAVERRMTISDEVQEQLLVHFRNEAEVKNAK